jgi:hypothetical protein
MEQSRVCCKIIVTSSLAEFLIPRAGSARVRVVDLTRLWTRRELSVAILAAEHVDFSRGRRHGALRFASDFVLFENPARAKTVCDEPLNDRNLRLQVFAFILVTENCMCNATYVLLYTSLLAC